jgi:DNA-binding MarR family transcriptional regulator
MLRGPMTVGTLAASIGVERTTLTRNLALIEREGWVRLRPGEDARSRVVAMTTAGIRKIEIAYPAWRQAQSAVSKAIGAAGVTALHRLAADPVN